MADLAHTYRRPLRAPWAPDHGAVEDVWLAEDLYRWRTAAQFEAVEATLSGLDRVCLGQGVGQGLPRPLRIRKPKPGPHSPATPCL